VHNLFALATSDHADKLRKAFNGPVTAACVGPVCAEGALQEGVSNPLTPSVGRLGLLVRTLSDHLSEQRRTFRSVGHEIVLQGAAIELDGTVDQLTPQERAILDLLVRKPGAVVSRESFLAKVWGCSSIDPHLLEVAIGRVRRRLGPAGVALQAIPSRGYRLDTEDQHA
jgi:uroporphyrinogen-III synthase